MLSSNLINSSLLHVFSDDYLINVLNVFLLIYLSLALTKANGKTKDVSGLPKTVFDSRLQKGCFRSGCNPISCRSKKNNSNNNGCGLPLSFRFLDGRIGEAIHRTWLMMCQIVLIPLFIASQTRPILDLFYLCKDPVLTYRRK